MNNLTLRLVLTFITDQFTQALNAARARLGDLSGSAGSSGTAVGGFQQRIDRAFRSVLDFGGAIRGLVAGFSLLAIAAGIKELVGFADNLRLIEGRVRNASSGVIDFAKNYAQLVLISFATGTSFAENATMFSRINAGILEMGGTSKDTLRQVDLLAKSMRISNTAASESASVIRQWAQAMASGLLRGDEYNSMAENSPRIMKAVADGLRVNIGVLRAMAEAGELTAAKVSQALVSQGKAIDDEFKKLPVSVGNAFEKIKTVFGQYVADADRGKGATAGLASGIELLANNLVPVLDTLITLAKITLVVFAGSALSSLTTYIAAQYQVLVASRALAAMTVAHTEALQMDMQRTVQLTAAKVADIQTELAATQARLAGTLSMGERMAVTNSLNVQTQALTAATMAQADANAALSASTLTLGARLKALPFQAMNVAMVAIVAYMIGDWLRSFSTVRVGAIVAVDAIVSALANLEYHIKKAGLQWDLFWTIDTSKQQALTTALADLDAQFIEGAKAREMAKNQMLAEEEATKKVATETDTLIDSFKNIKTPQQTFIEKSRELTKELNEGRISTDLYTKALLSLHSAMQKDIEKQQTPFEEEKAKLQDKQDKATLAPEAYQRKQYSNKGFSAPEVDELMTTWTATEASKDEKKDDKKQQKEAASQAKHDQLAAAKDQQDALKIMRDSDIKQLESTFKEQELGFKRQGLTELQLQAKSLAAAKELTAAKLRVERDFIKHSNESEVEKQGHLQRLAVDEKNAAIEQADAELALKKRVDEQKKQLDNEQAGAERAAALDALSEKEIASQQELDLSNITQEQHLANLRNFAAERLAIEQKLLEDKRKLLNNDALALAQNLNEQKALRRASAAEVQGIDNQDALTRKEHFKKMFAPLENALDQSVNGVISGQQTIKNAVKNAGQSIVLSYATTFIKTRVMSAAQWAWEAAGFAGKEAKKKAIENASFIWEGLLWVKKKAMIAGQWAWDVLGFGTAESTKTGIKVANEGAQTGAAVGADIIQTTSKIAAEETKQTVTAKTASKSIMAKAYDAAAGVYSSLSDIPYVGWILAPIAAAATFITVAGWASMVGSAKGGEWQVGEDGSPYILHKDESVLPAGVAEGWRKVVSIVNTHVDDAGTGKKLSPAAEINQLFATGQLKPLALPDFALNLTRDSQTAANGLARDRVKADKERLRNPVTGGAKSGDNHIHIHGIALAPEDFFRKNSRHVVSAATHEARKFNNGKKQS